MANRRKPSSKEIEAVLKLAGPDRYKHFVKVVADWEEVWGLYEDGWAMAGADDNTLVFPVWPALEYASICASGTWEKYQPKSIELVEFMEVVLPELKEEKILPGVFYTPSDKGILPPVDQLLADLQEECAKYE